MVLGTAAFAQEYPAKPVKIITPLGPGSAVDITTRKLSTETSRALQDPRIRQKLATIGVEPAHGREGALSAL